MTTSEIKFYIQKSTPKTIFKIIYFIWSIFFLKLLNISNNLRLRNFAKDLERQITIHGETFKILISPNRGTVDNEIFLQGAYEPYFLKKIKQNLKSGNVFVDIGANIGQHSLFARSIVGEQGKVISFEPILDIYKQFLQSIQLNNFENIYLHNVACGNSVSKLNIHISKSNMGASSIVDTRKGKSLEIDVLKADTVLEKEVRVDFIKIDVEGYEYEALLGLQNTIKKFSPIIMIEYSPYYYTGERVSDNKKILEFIFENNYQIFDLENNNEEITLDYLKIVKCEKILQTNFLCIKK